MRVRGGAFFVAFPADWRELIALLAADFHWPPRELLDLDADDLAWWAARRDWVQERIRASTPPNGG